MQRGVAPDTPVGGAANAFARAHAKLISEGDLQFDQAALTAPKPPGWLRWFVELLQTLAPVLKWGFWIGLAIVVALILYFITREIIRLRAPLARAKPLHMGPEPEWRPNSATALDLLAAADQLAAEGRFAEAAHLILLRSVEDIEGRRPRAVRPALTTREIASLAAIPASARPAFATIGQLVERSLFGGSAVAAEEFADCRSAYVAFALPEGWSA